MVFGYFLDVGSDSLPIRLREAFATNDPVFRLAHGYLPLDKDLGVKVNMLIGPEILRTFVSSSMKIAHRNLKNEITGVLLSNSVCRFLKSPRVLLMKMVKNQYELLLRVPFGVDPHLVLRRHVLFLHLN